MKTIIFKNKTYTVTAGHTVPESLAAEGLLAQLTIEGKRGATYLLQMWSTRFGILYKRISTTARLQVELVKTFTLEHKLCDADPASEVPEAIWDGVFSFTAKDEEDARAKADGWARYQAMDLRDVRIRPANDHEAIYWLHNEWVD